MYINIDLNLIITNSSKNNITVYFIQCCNCISFLLTGSDNGEANVVLHPTEHRQPSVVPDSPARPGEC